MDIESILSALGLDLTNPDVKRGAIEAIDAILSSRMPPESFGDMGDMSGSMGSNEQDIELDPDLILPSIKHISQESSDDIEINDEDEVLQDIKHNESEDSEESPMTNKSKSGNSDERQSESDASDNAESSSDSDEFGDNNSEKGSDAANDSGKTDDADNGSYEQESDSTDSVEAAEADNDADKDIDHQEENSGSLDDKSDEEASEEIDDHMPDDESGDVDAADEENSDTSGSVEPEDDSEDNVDFDEDELLDDGLKDTYDDKEQKAKHEARRIKRERTILAAEKALADAKAKRKSPALIRELERALKALESLTEAVKKTLKNMSDEEFNLVINSVLDAIDALGDAGLTYTSEEERKIKAQEIKADMENRQTQAELSAEDVAKIRAETQAIRAREKENAKYSMRSRSSFKGFQDFLSSLYRAIALQVHVEETKDDTWSAINRRYSGTGVLQQGKRINELPNKKIPVIDFYFDQSGSWTESDIKTGQKAVETLVDMEEKGQIKINIYYFANHVHTNAEDARNEGGTWAWNDIVKNVIATQATNVIIMTDSDMEDQWDMNSYWSGTQTKAATYTVPGYVWYLWRGGDNAPRLPRDLKGRGGTQQFAFNRGD